MLPFVLFRGFLQFPFSLGFSKPVNLPTLSWDYLITTSPAKLERIIPRFCKRIQLHFLLGFIDSYDKATCPALTPFISVRSRVSDITILVQVNSVLEW